MKRNFKLIVSVIASVGAFSGCYSFSSGKLDFKTVGVPVVENSTAEYRLVDVITSTLISAVNNDGRAKISDPEKAEAVLEMTVTNYARVPYEYTSKEQVNQYKVTITAKAKLRSSAGKPIWESAAVSGWSTYPASGSDEEAGMKKAADNLAAEVIRQSFETW